MIHKDKKMCNNTIIWIYVIYNFHQFLEDNRRFSHLFQKDKKLKKNGLLDHGTQRQKHAYHDNYLHLCCL
jgi:hypothetical protein